MVDETADEARPCDPYQQVNEAVRQLRAVYGRLPQFDTIEIGCATIEGDRRKLGAFADAVRGALDATT
jgi:hypothetical protein